PQGARQEGRRHPAEEEGGQGRHAARSPDPGRRALIPGEPPLPSRGRWCDHRETDAPPMTLPPDGPSAPTTPAPPRVWPVFVALAAFLPAAAMGAVALAVPFVLARLASPSDPLHGRPAEVLPRLERLLLTPGFIAASSAATSALFACIAL